VPKKKGGARLAERKGIGVNERKDNLSKKLGKMGKIYIKIPAIGTVQAPSLQDRKGFSRKNDTGGASILFFLGRRGKEFSAILWRTDLSIAKSVSKGENATDRHADGGQLPIRARGRMKGSHLCRTRGMTPGVYHPSTSTPEGTIPCINRRPKAIMSLKCEGGGVKGNVTLLMRVKKPS